MLPTCIRIGCSISGGKIHFPYCKTWVTDKKRTAFENSRKITTIVFVKTGTLTIGKFGGSKIALLQDGITENDLIRYASAPEQKSEHPIATGILQKAKEIAITIPATENFNSITGQGVEALVEGKEIKVVSPGYLKENNMSYIENLEVNEYLILLNITCL